MTAELARRGHQVNHKRVERLMVEYAMAGIHKPAKERTTIPAEHNPPLPDLVRRVFSPCVAVMNEAGNELVGLFPGP